MAFKTGLEKEQVVRLPLVGAINTRVGFGVSGTSAVDQNFTNCIIESVPNPLTGAKKYYVSKRPGWRQIASAPGGTDVGTALKIVNAYSTVPIAIAAYGLSNSTVYYVNTVTQSIASLGATTGFIRHIEEISIGPTVYAVMLSSDSTGWYYPMGSGTGATQTFTADTSSGVATLINIASTANLYVGMAVSGTGIPANTRILSVDSSTQVTMTANATATNAGITVTRSTLAKIIDSDFPGNASRTLTGRFVAMNGYLYVMDTEGYIYNSDNGSITSWTALNKILAQSSPDKGVGIIRYKDYIVAFGTESIESYEDVGNESGTPLQRVSNSYFKIGCNNQAAYCEMPDGIAWISSNTLGEQSVYVMSGAGPKKISTKAIDTRIVPSSPTVESSSGIPTNTITAFSHFGKTLIAVGVHSLSYASASLVYCVEEDVWVSWDTGAGVNFWDVTSSVSGRTDTYSKVWGISRNYEVGHLYSMSLSLYSDAYSAGADASITMVIRTNKFDGENSLLKKLTKLYLVGDTNKLGSVASTNNVSVLWNDDDYTTASNSTARTIDLYSGNLCLPGCGSFRRRSFTITSSTSQPVRLEALELHIKQGSH